jgi:hypothetical protein
MNILQCFFHVLLSCLLLCGCSQHSGETEKIARHDSINGGRKKTTGPALKESLPVIQAGTDRKLVGFLSFFQTTKAPQPVGYVSEELLKDSVEYGRPIEKDSIKRLADVVVKRYLLFKGESLYRADPYDTIRYNFYPVLFCIATPKYYGVIVERYLASAEGTSEKFYCTINLQGRLINRIRIAACEFAGYETTLDDGSRGPWWKISAGLIKNHIELYGEDDNGRFACYMVNEEGIVSLIHKTTYDSVRNTKSLHPSIEDLALIMR